MREQQLTVNQKKIVTISGIKERFYILRIGTEKENSKKKELALTARKIYTTNKFKKNEL